MIHVATALETVPTEQKLSVDVRSRLTYQLSDGETSLDELEADIRWADIVLFDLRAAAGLC